LEQKDGFGVFKKTLRIFKSIFLMVFVSHLLGCFFTMLIDPNSEDNWLYAYNPKLMDAPVWERYTVSLYWAIITISTMGYGDVLPVTSTERVFSVAVALIGAVVFSYSMGNITSLISQTAGADVKFDEKLRFVEASIHLFHLCDPQIFARWPLVCKIGLIGSKRLSRLTFFAGFRRSGSNSAKFPSKPSGRSNRSCTRGGEVLGLCLTKRKI
jgi:hypothetical protein